MSSEAVRAIDAIERPVKQREEIEAPQTRKQPSSAYQSRVHRVRHSLDRADTLETDPLLTADDVAARLNVTKDWVWDHSSRKTPLLPVIRLGDGTLRYRASRIEEFINEMERLSGLRRKRR